MINLAFYKKNKIISLIRLILRKSTLAKSLIWYLGGDMFVKGLGFLTIPIFTRLLTVDEYGLIAVYTSYVGIMSIIVSLNLHSSIGRGFYDFTDERKQFLSSILTLSLIIFIITILILFPMREKIAIYLAIPSFLIAIGLFHSYFKAIVTFGLTVLNFSNRYKSRAIFSISIAIFSVIIGIFLIMKLPSAKYLGRIIGFFLASGIAAIFILSILIGRGQKFFWKKSWKYALCLGIPLIPHSLSHVLLAQFDRIAINTLVGHGEAGLYSFSYNLGMIVVVFLGSLNSAWVPWFYKKMSDSSYVTINKVARIYTGVFSMVVLLIVTFAPELGKMMAPEEYWRGLILIPVIALSYHFQFIYTLYVNYVFYMKKMFSISISTILAGLLNIILNLLFIPRFGYQVAAWTTVISYIFLFFFHYLNLYRMRHQLLIVSIKEVLSLSIWVIAFCILVYSVSCQIGTFSIVARMLRLFLAFIFLGILGSRVLKDISKYFN